MDAQPTPESILRAWQRIEFFQPYTLDEKKQSIRLTLSELRRAGDRLLPWLNAELREQCDIPDRAAYVIHLGLFDKSIANQVARQVFGTESGLAAEENEQRLDNEGITCFAKVVVDKHGAPALQDLSVSSLPWALGHLAQQRFNQLHSQTFKNHCETLADKLTTFALSLRAAVENGPRILGATDVLALLHDELVPWADFSPAWKYALQIDWFESGSSASEHAAEDDTADEDEAGGSNNIALPILNSFFFDDLEIVSASLHPSQKSKSLRAYLSNESVPKIDLYSQSAMDAIITLSHPAKTPPGRWPADPRHNMSLMQQFAINAATTELADGGILSVNGPPGTGKTTLLRDLVAHNVVERARVLSGFTQVADTLDKNGLLVPALCGFEMVIASSNNAAVENISKELPQQSSIAEAYREINYLAASANQIAAAGLPRRDKRTAKEPNGKSRTYHLFRPLETDKQCWGVISAALGSKKNRQRFAQRFLIDEHFLRDTPAEANRPQNENFLSLWRWWKCHQHTSFAEAKRAFLHQLKQTDALQQQLVTLADLHASEPQDFTPLKQQLNALQQQLTQQVRARNLAETQNHALEVQIRHLLQQQKVLDATSPGWFSRLLNRKKVQAYQQEKAAVQQNLLQLTQQQVLYAQQLEVAQRKTGEIESQIQHVQQHLQQLIDRQAAQAREVQALQQRFPDVAMPDPACAIDDVTLQRNALWQNKEINDQRSRLFVAAMALHQAWLNEALYQPAFRSVLFGMSDFLASPQKSPQPVREWQTLFMMVPVLSTTFASVGRMFSGVGAEELGWLLIDEAGQASPQQAVGAIWRAKRVLVVGDPLQIEPVFTTSPALVKYLCEDTLARHADHWNPGLLSVQQVADRTNHWGCELEVMNQVQSIGIPLWVHRRCREPMFSLANRMAYNGRMIHGLDTEAIRARPLQGLIHNRWIHVTGKTTDKQYHDSLGDGLLQLLDTLLSQHVALASLYIITPFKAVKFALIDRLAQRDLHTWRQWQPMLKQKEIKEWQEKNIGTVHTFQGKENDTVILVLGCDEENKGGAHWAASKPNLLNVALTRAKNNIFVIGNRTVWGELPGFTGLISALETASVTASQPWINPPGK